jgi:glycosyltransferase involved in cell wall biosynthesis
VIGAAAKRAMRIVHVVPSLAAVTGGPAQVAVQLTTALAKRGHRVQLLATQHGGKPVDTAPAREAGVDVQLCRLARPAFFRRSVEMKRRLVAALPATDVVHIHGLYLYPTWMAAGQAGPAGVPYLLRPHGLFEPFRRARRGWRKQWADATYHRPVVRGAAAIHFASEIERRNALPLTLGRPSIVIPNGLDLEVFGRLPPRGTFRAKYPELRTGRIVLHFGRVSRVKGLDVLTQAFARLAPRHSDLRLVIAGPATAEWGARLDRWLREAGIRDRTTVTGLLSGPDKYACLVDADVFALASPSESFGVAVVEALAAGTPVVVSDQVGICPQIAAADVGLVAPVDVAAFATVMESLLADESRRRALSGRGPKFVRETYAWERIVPDLEQAYEGLIDGSRSRRQIPEIPSRS